MKLKIHLFHLISFYIQIKLHTSFKWNNKFIFFIKFWNVVYRTALHIAVIKGNADIIQLLLDKPDINMKIKDDIFFPLIIDKVSFFLF